MSFEFTPVDKTVRPPELVRARLINKVRAALESERMEIRDRALTEFEADGAVFRELKAVRDEMILAGNASAPISMRLVLLATAQHFGLTASAIIAPNRIQKVNKARHFAVFLVNKLTGNSLTSAGHFFRRHHTSVLHGIRVIQELVDMGDADTLSAIAAIEEAIKP